MSTWSRITNVFRSESVIRDLDEEFESHIHEAVEEGRDPAAARKAFGSALRHREASRDLLVAAWLDSLRADIVFGWRQLMKRKVMSAAAVLSLALAIGACMTAFRLIDALLFRPLPIAEPQRLYALSWREPGGGVGSALGYADFTRLRGLVKGQVDLIGISGADRMDLTWSLSSGLADSLEKANVQFVSGRMFSSFGLRPALGRLLTEGDDLEPGAHPIAVLSYDYWTRRFARDPNVIGRSFEMGRKYGTGNDLFEIVGVIDKGFTGTESGRITDIFAPSTMSAFVNRPDAAWLTPYVLLSPGAQERLRAVTTRVLGHSATPWMKAPDAVFLEPAAAGVSGMRKDYRNPLVALSVMVALVLLIACANVANLMTAQRAARVREMALRVSIGASKWRLLQLVLVESILLALIAAGGAALFTWWSAPFVTGRIGSPDNPVRFSLDIDWRILAVGLSVTLLVGILCGLAPAKASRRLMYVLIAVQAAFGCLVLFVAGLFAATFERLSHQSPGFSEERLLNIDTTAERAQPPVFWDQVAEHLRNVPGVETVTVADWPPLDGYSYKYNAISIDGGPPTAVAAAFMNVSPGWLGAMKIPFVAGRDFRPNDTSPGVAIVNQAFARQYFNGENPIGRWFAGTEAFLRGQRFQVVGMVRDVRYRSLRQDVLPVAYTPFHRLDANGAIEDLVDGTFTIRTVMANPMALASTLRREVTASRPGFRVTNLRSEREIIESQTMRERMLAMLGLFFAAIALLLAAVGLYGVLHYSVSQRRREIGIRLALGEPAGEIAARVTARALAMVVIGALAGLGLGAALGRYIETLLYDVKPTELSMRALPLITLLAIAVLAALPTVFRATGINPAALLKAE
jgi:predicted permease